MFPKDGFIKYTTEVENMNWINKATTGLESANMALDPGALDGLSSDYNYILEVFCHRVGGSGWGRL